MDQKAITNQIYVALDGLKDPLKRLAGYIDFIDKNKMINISDFGIKDLRRCITSRDVDGAIEYLHLVNANLTKFKEELVLQGLTEELIARFVLVASTIDSDRQKQYESIVHRRGLVQDNNEIFSRLNESLIEILKVGKILYKNTNRAKRMEYTFSDLLKRVRVSHKTTAPAEKVAAPVPDRQNHS